MNSNVVDLTGKKIEETENEKPTFNILECECGNDKFRIGTIMGRTFFICSECDFNYGYEIKFAIQSIGKPIPEKPEVTEDE
jgi:hypothetical protein